MGFNSVMELIILTVANFLYDDENIHTTALKLTYGIHIYWRLFFAIPRNNHSQYNYETIFIKTTSKWSWIMCGAILAGGYRPYKLQLTR